MRPRTHVRLFALYHAPRLVCPLCWRLNASWSPADTVVGAASRWVAGRAAPLPPPLTGDHVPYVPPHAAVSWRQHPLARKRNVQEIRGAHRKVGSGKKWGQGVAPMAPTGSTTSPAPPKCARQAIGSSRGKIEQSSDRTAPRHNVVQRKATFKRAQNCSTPHPRQNSALGDGKIIVRRKLDQRPLSPFLAQLRAPARRHPRWPLRFRRGGWRELTVRTVGGAE